MVEGADQGLWSFSDKDYQQDLIYRYDAEQASYRHAQAKTPAGPAYAAGGPAPNAAPTATATALSPNATAAADASASGPGTPASSAPVASAAPWRRATGDARAPAARADRVAWARVATVAAARRRGRQERGAGDRGAAVGAGCLLARRAAAILPEKQTIPEDAPPAKVKPEARAFKVPKAKSAAKGSIKTHEAGVSKTRDEDAAEARKKKLIRALTGDVASEDPSEAGEGDSAAVDGGSLEEDPGWSHLDVRGKAPMETGAIGAP